jgi:hypothetical protein
LFFATSNGSASWMWMDRGEEIVFIKDQSTIIGNLTPDGRFTLQISNGVLNAEYIYQHMLRHLGVQTVRLVRPTNMETHYELQDDKGQLVGRVTYGDLYLEGKYIGSEPSHLMCLNLGCYVPPQFQPKSLPKVPRAVIAQLREHVQKQWDIATIAARVSTNKVVRGGVLPSDNRVLSALAHDNIRIRGQLMATDHPEFWRHAQAYYNSPATLIDSCRCEFYNAAGVRPKPVEPPKFVPLSVHDAPYPEPEPLPPGQEEDED